MKVMMYVLYILGGFFIIVAATGTLVNNFHPEFAFQGSVYFSLAMIMQGLLKIMTKLGIKDDN